MAKVIKYSVIIFFFIFLVAGSLYFYLKKDGYQVTFNSNGGSIIAPQKTGLKKNITKPSDPEKDGYIFLGWYLDTELFDFTTPVTTNITLTAHWEQLREPTYTLRFDSLGGTPIEDVLITEGHLLSDIAYPSKEGYEFIAWMYHNQQLDLKSPITHNMVLVAKYQKIEAVIKTATVTFDTQGGSPIDPLTVNIGSLAKMPMAPTKENFRFVGWYLNDSEFTFLEPITEDITLVAMYEEL